MFYTKKDQQRLADLERKVSDQAGFYENKINALASRLEAIEEQNKKTAIRLDDVHLKWIEHSNKMYRELSDRINILDAAPDTTPDADLANRVAMLEENSPINKESLKATMEELIERTSGYSADIYELKQQDFEGLYKLYRMMRMRVETLEKQCPPKPTPKSRSKPSSDRKLTGTKSRQPRKASGAK